MPYKTRYLTLLFCLFLSCSKESMEELTPESEIPEMNPVKDNALVGSWHYIAYTHEWAAFPYDLMEKEVTWHFQNEGKVRITVDSDFEFASFLPTKDFLQGVKDTTLNYVIYDQNKITIAEEEFAFKAGEKLLVLFYKFGTHHPKAYLIKQ